MILSVSLSKYKLSNDSKPMCVIICGSIWDLALGLRWILITQRRLECYSDT